MDLDDLIAVQAVISEGTFSGAASALRIAQPSLSRRIARLEHELGGALFDRGPRRAVASALGESIAASAGRILAEMERAREDAAAITHGAAGRIRLSCLAGGIPALSQGLARFATERPDVVVELRALDAVQAVRALIDRQVDLATLPGSALESGMRHRKLATWRVVLAVRPNDPFARARSLTIAQLASRPVLLLAPEFMVTRHVTDLAGRTGLQLDARLRDGTPEAVLSLARRGIGIGVLPDSVRIPKDLVAIPLARAGSSADFDFVVAWITDRTLPPAAHALVDVLERETRAFRG